MTNTDRTSAFYDAIDAFQRTHRLPSLQHAQIRGLLAEHLARAVPDAPAVVEPPADQTGEVRDQLLHAIDFNYVASLGYTSPEELLAAYDTSRTQPADRAALHRIAEAALAAVETALGDTLAADAREEALAGIAAVLPKPADRAAVPAAFVLWLDASDGSVPTHDGIVWPDGTATVHHRHFGHTTTHTDAETARQAAHRDQGRIVWPEIAGRATGLREAITVLDRRASGIDALSSSDFGEEARAVRELADAATELRRMADETAPETTQPDSTTLLELVRDFLDPDPCSFDHHGYCQAHGYLGGEPMSCPHGRARKLLAALEQPAAGARQDRAQP